VALVALSLIAPSSARAGIIASNPSSPDPSGVATTDAMNIRLTLSQSPLPNVFPYVDLYGPSGQTPVIDFDISYDTYLPQPPATVSGIESNLGSFSSYRFNLPSAKTTFPVAGAYVVELRNMVATAGFYGDAPNVPFLITNSSLLIGLINPFDPGDDKIYDGTPFQFSLGAVAVPEPSTYAMALAGLACGGYSLFRRRKRA
jgi:hypothetical protein